jgi:hypothetical protein
MCNEKKDMSGIPVPELIKEQYTQYYQMLRHHTSLSWSIPSFAVACSVLFFGLDSSKMRSWDDYPLLPALCFLFIGLFLFVMLKHHIRNGFYAHKFDEALLKIERMWGYKLRVHHSQLEPEKSFFKRISSSLCLSVFLWVLIILSLSVSIYYFCRHFS